jgi:ech hydrogenase subunit E
MTLGQVERLGAVGPTARASGFSHDVRVEAPYAAYEEFPVEMITAQAGDLHARFIVRIEELFESIRVIREILNNMPESELVARVPRRIPAGETISRVEAPRGELFYFIASNGSDMPERVRVRTPSLCNWGTVITLAVGHKLADMPMLLSGIDPCFSCNDRMINVVRNHHEPQLWTWEDLRLYGIEYYR